MPTVTSSQWFRRVLLVSVSMFTVGQHIASAQSEKLIEEHRGTYYVRRTIVAPDRVGDKAYAHRVVEDIRTKNRAAWLIYVCISDDASACQRLGGTFFESYAAYVALFRILKAQPLPRMMEAVAFGKETMIRSTSSIRSCMEEERVTINIEGRMVSFRWVSFGERVSDNDPMPPDGVDERIALYFTSDGRASRKFAGRLFHHFLNKTGGSSLSVHVGPTPWFPDGVFPVRYPVCDSPSEVPPEQLYNVAYHSCFGKPGSQTCY